MRQGLLVRGLRGVGLLSLLLLATGIVATRSPARGSGAPPIHVDLEPAVVVAKPTARPGHYVFSPDLRLDVDARVGGWRLLLVGEPLRKRGAPSIPRKAVRARMPDGTEAPLAKPLVYIRDGRRGSTEIEITLSLLLEGARPGGEFEGRLHLVLQDPRGPGSVTRFVDLRIDLRRRAMMTLTGNRVHFHFGRLPAEQDAVVGGRVASDLPLHLFIRAKDGARVEGLPMRRHLLESREAAGAVPIRWHLAEGPEGYRPPEHRRRDGTRLGWRLRGTPGELRYRLRLTARPEVHQAPGDYSGAFEILLVPEL